MRQTFTNLRDPYDLPRNNSDFIIEFVTDNFWTIVGDQTIEGKERSIKALKEMEAAEPMELTIHHIITRGKEASVDGVMYIPDEDKAYAFCDVYKFSGFKTRRSPR